jgi:hypothetical protein
MRSDQEELRNEINVVRSMQAELEEKVTGTADKQLKGVRAAVE